MHAGYTVIGLKWNVIQNCIYTISHRKVKEHLVAKQAKETDLGQVVDVNIGKYKPTVKTNIKINRLPGSYYILFNFVSFIALKQFQLFVNFLFITFYS